MIEPRAARLNGAGRGCQNFNFKNTTFVPPTTIDDGLTPLLFRWVCKVCKETYNNIRNRQQFDALYLAVYMIMKNLTFIDTYTYYVVVWFPCQRIWEPIGQWYLPKYFNLVVININTTRYTEISILGIT